MDRMTDVSKNITLSQTSFSGGKDVGVFCNDLSHNTKRLITSRK